MAGWNLKQGSLSQEEVTEEEFWALFNSLFSNSSKKRNTYKFGFLKSILDNIFNVTQQEQGQFLSYQCIFNKFAENYWNLVLKYHLKQMRKDGRSEVSRIESILLDYASRNPSISNLEFSSISDSEREQIVSVVKKNCIRNVVGAMYNDFEGKFYGFDIKGPGIMISHSAYDFILKFKPEIESLNYYAWAKFLEQINADDVILRVIDKLELSTPRRNDLTLYRNILYMEYEQHNCFYCGSKLTRSIHVDHFIPWSFVKDDRIWNFVLSCPTCNSKKNNKLPSPSYIDRLIERNKIMINNGTLKEEFSSYTSKTIIDMWHYAKMSGLKEFNSGS